MIRCHFKLMVWILLVIGVFNWDTFSYPSDSTILDAQAGNDVINLLKPTGKFSVGSCFKHVIDSSRKEIATKRSAPRALNLRIWYPVDTDFVSEKMEYMIDADQYMDAYGPDMIKLMKNVCTHSSHIDKVSDQQTAYPLLILSPGFSANHTLYTMLSEDLASNGYIVAVIDHPYLNSTILNGHFIDPTNAFWHASPVAPGREQSTEQYNTHLATALKYLGMDVQFIMDLFTAWNNNDPDNIFSDKIKLDNIAVAGHSAGYLPALGALLNDSRVNVMITFDVALDEGNPKIEKKINKNILIFRFEYASKTGEKFLESMGGSTYDVFVKNATHLSVMDLPFIQSQTAAGDPNSGNIQEILQLIKKLTVAFLNDQFSLTNESFDEILDNEKSSIDIEVYHFQDK